MSLWLNLFSKSYNNCYRLFYIEHMYVAMYVRIIEILSQIPFYTQCRLDTHDCTIVSNLYYASDVYNNGSQWNDYWYVTVLL